MRINIETIPHDRQRYPTVGDYWQETDRVQQVRVSQMPDWRFEALVAVHELIEMILVQHRGIPEQSITDFDIRFEEARETGQAVGEPGDDPRAPYQREHFFATNIERLLAAELGVDWFAYETLVDGLGVKK